MSKIETVRREKLGNTELRLARRDQHFFGMADGSVLTEVITQTTSGGGYTMRQARLITKYFGYDGARRAGYTSRRSSKITRIPSRCSRFTTISCASIKRFGLRPRWLPV